MEVLHNGYTLQICDGAFPLSTDSMVLAHFAQLPKNAAVLDLGSGCGTLGLLLCAKDANCTVTGIELTENAHAAALENSSRNGLTSRLSSVCGDLRHHARLVPPGQFSVCLSNPPYFAAGPESKTLPLARREDACTLEDIFRAAAWGLKYGGDFFTVHRTERLAQLCSLGSRHGLEPKTLLLLRHREDGPIALVLLQCRKGGRPGLTIREESLHHPDGSPTDFYRSVYHI